MSLYNNYNGSRGFIYLIENGHNEYKIGKSKNPKRRLGELQTASATKLVLLESVECDYYNNVETALHNFLRTYKLEGEHFDLPRQYVDTFFELCKQVEQNIKTIFEGRLDNFI